MLTHAQRANAVVREYVTAVFDSIPERAGAHAILLVQGDTPMYVSKYLSEVEGLRPDVTVLPPNPLPPNMRSITSEAACQCLKRLLRTPSSAAKPKMLGAGARHAWSWEALQHLVLYTYYENARRCAAASRIVYIL